MWIWVKNRRSGDDRKKLTASHLLLYIVLVIYVMVAVTGIVFIKKCVGIENYECASSVYIALCTFCGTCSSISVGFYCNKAKKENEIQIANAKYKMRFELAEKIFKAKGNTLDKESVELLRRLMSDEDISESRDDNTQSYAQQTGGYNPYVPTFEGLNNDDGLGEG